MPDDSVAGQQDGPAPVLPGLRANFLCFFWIGAQSFGGGLSAWIRGAVVDRHAWMTDRPFLTGLAVAQICPGANAANLAVYVGAALRGPAGAGAAFAGVMAVPVALTAAAGSLYLGGHGPPGLDRALRGMGAAAIGLMLAYGIQLFRRLIRDTRVALVTTAAAIMVGLLHLKLPIVLAMVVPASFVLLGRGQAR